jgi:NADPH2:quinone reductase
MSDARAILLREHGDPDTLRVEPIDLAPPGPGMLRVRQTAIGINFHDIYVRTGLYRTLPLPGIPGVEATGIVEEVGEGVKGWRPGDRLGYVSSAYGGYASHRNLPAAIALPLPDDISDALAAATMVRGLTVEMLIGAVHRLTVGETILIHAAAGGVGRLLVEAAAQRGARVIGTVGSEAKAAIARKAGAHETIFYREEDFVARVRASTEGDGVDAVYDSVGIDTISGSFSALKPCGHLIIFGQSSGPCPPIEVAALAAKSLTVSRPILFDYLRDSGQARAMAQRLFASLHDGGMTPPEVTSMPLEKAPDAHRLLESREAHGSVVLTP